MSLIKSISLRVQHWQAPSLVPGTRNMQAPKLQQFSKFVPRDVDRGQSGEIER